MTYNDFTSIMRAQNNKDLKRNLKGRIIITADSFDKEYSLEARTYGVSNDNKAWIAGMGGYSIYGGSLDGTDVCVRLEGYLAPERGGKDGWKVEDCYFTEGDKDIYDAAEMRSLLGLN